MSQISRRNAELRDVARRFADSLPAAFDEVLLTGSVSRGDADDLSDIEMLLAYRGASPPPLGAVQLYDDESFEEGTVRWYTALVEGEILEMAGWPHARVESRLDGILAGEMLDHARFRFAEALAHGVALRTDGAIAEWQRRVETYPDVLVERLILEASEEWLEHPAGVRSHLRPGGRLPLTRMLVDDMENVLRIVFAVNRRWEPSWKRLPSLVAPLAVKPDHLAERIDEALREVSLRKGRELVLETLRLAPDFDRVVLARERTEALLAELQ